MKKTHTIIAIIIVLLCFSNLTGQQTYQTAKPWTYWWWMGSAVNRTDIKEQLSDFAQAGLGGVHIIPIYGVKGFENYVRITTGDVASMMKITEEIKRAIG